MNRALRAVKDIFERELLVKEYVDGKGILTKRPSIDHKQLFGRLKRYMKYYCEQYELESIVYTYFFGTTESRVGKNGRIRRVNVIDVDTHKINEKIRSTDNSTQSDNAIYIALEQILWIWLR